MSAAAVIDVLSPATGRSCGQMPSLTGPAVNAILDRAAAAQPAWAALDFTTRARHLRRLARAMARDEQLLDTLVAETGKPRYEAEGIELLYALELTRFLSGRAGRRALAEERRRPFFFRTKRARVVYHPRGVVGVIGPWNWPLLNNYADAIAPLVAGNAVVLKPSRLTPLTSMRIAQLWRDLGSPADVFHVVTGGTEVADILLDRVDLVFFTGSGDVGRHVAKRCAERVIPAILELGGKSPMIVLGDADLPRAARAAIWSAFANSGQVCIRTERVIVDRAVAERFIALVSAGVAALRQGDATGSADIDVGPARQLEHLDHLERQIRDAVAKGARVVAGGTRRSELGAHFFAPTVLADCTPDMLVMRDETFGPVLPIMAVDGFEQAIRVANDPPGGLSGSVWSRDRTRALDAARRLHTGSVCINDALVNYLCVEAPLGGADSSGLGFRHGAEALRQFCRVETIVEDTAWLGRASGLVSRQIGFPYQPRMLRLLRWVAHRY
jgi:acyl-CoA reductase-like NAD-dependent aldehyde dehydrogenase